MTERDRTPDLARAVAAFNDETRDNIALALWMEELDENQTVELQFAISEAGGPSLSGRADRPAGDQWPCRLSDRPLCVSAGAQHH